MTDTRCRDAFTEQDVDRVVDHRISAPFDELVAEYETRVGDRDRFLWKWLDLLVPEIKLSCVDASHREQARLAKLVATVFVVLLDDLAEKRRDRATLAEASKIPFGNQSIRLDAPGVDGGFLRFADRVWTRFEAELSRGPRVDEFGDVLSFDVRQNGNAVEYASLANDRLDLVNLREATRHGSDNMMLLTYADVDLAYATVFDPAELAALRRAGIDAREMLRIVNWLATWGREVAEGDYSSGVLVYALENGIVSPADLLDVRERGTPRDHEWLVETIRDRDVECRLVERYFLVRYGSTSFDAELATVDLGAYLDGIQTVSGYYLGTGKRL